MTPQSKSHQEKFIERLVSRVANYTDYEVVADWQYANVGTLTIERKDGFEPLVQVTVTFDRNDTKSLVIVFPLGVHQQTHERLRKALDGHTAALYVATPEYGWAIDFLMEEFRQAQIVANEPASIRAARQARR